MARYFGLAVQVGILFVASPAFAQLAGSDPTAGLVTTLEGFFGSLFNLASALGALAAVVGGILAYAGFIPRDWVKNILVISGFIIVVPQVVRIIFESAGGTGGLFGG